MSEAGSRKCTQCGSPIQVEAVHCPVCHADQRPWRRNLTFLAQIAGFLALVGSASLYSSNQIIALHSKLTGKERPYIVWIQAAESGSKVVIANSGTMPAFVESVRWKWRDEDNNFDVNSVSRPGDYMVSVNNQVTEPTVTHTSILANETGQVEPWMTLSKTCVLKTLLLPDSTALRMFAENLRGPHKRLITSPASIDLAYFSDRTRSIEHSYQPGVVIFEEIKSEICRLEGQRYRLLGLRKLAPPASGG